MTFDKQLFAAGKICWLTCIWILGCWISAQASTAPNGKLPFVSHVSFPGIVYDPLKEQDSLSFTVPFSKAGNLILVKAKADTTEGNFILDTGCPGLVLNITYFRNYDISTVTDIENAGITGSSGGLEQTTIRRFDFGGISSFNGKADLVNLGSIENIRGVKILGLIGMQFLKDCELIIDYQKYVIYFHLISHKESPTYQHNLLRDTSSYYTLPFEVTEGRIIVRTTLAGKKVKLLIDCAAETNVLDSRLPDKVFENISITGRVLLTGVGNKKVEAVKGNLPIFIIGSQQVNNLPVLITNLEQSCLSHGGCVDGVLGLDNLSMQKIGFNFVTHKMYIWK